MAFEALTQEMDQTVRKLRGADGVVTEAAIGGALEEVRRAMLAADVEPPVAARLLADVRERAVGGGAVVAAAGTEPAARFVSILVEELSAVMGKDAALAACLASTLDSEAAAPSRSPPPSQAQPPAKRPASSPTTAILDTLDAADRPAWLPAAAPAWMGDAIVYIRQRPWLQLLIAFPLYALHVLYFSTGGWKLPSAVIPNGKGLFSNVGFDTAAGAVVALGTLIIRKFLLRLPRALPPLLSSDTPPWKVSRADKRKIANTTVLLVVAYLASGYGAVLIEQVLFLLAGLGVPLTIATTRAWKVLLGHLIWVFAGVKILRSKLNPFFPRRGSWMSWKWRTNWLAWAVGGYYVSAMFFNGADVLNHWLLPASLFNEDTVVSKLINPENRDVMAMAVGCVGPCITAPVFEEVLYRGFLLPALACYLPMWAAIPVSSVLFAVHHLNIQGVLPLTVLGFIWAILYTKSNNLAVTIIIHAMYVDSALFVFAACVCVLSTCCRSLGLPPCTVLLPDGGTCWPPPRFRCVTDVKSVDAWQRCAVACRSLPSWLLGNPFPMFRIPQVEQPSLLVELPGPPQFYRL